MVQKQCVASAWYRILLKMEVISYTPLGYINCMQTVAETPTFTRQANSLFSEIEKSELIEYLANNPLTGDGIPGTGGVESCDSQLRAEAGEVERG